MIFDGWMLIAASPGQRPEWTRGSWAIEDGRVARLGRPGRADVRGYAVPGMVDGHCHIGITDGGGSVGGSDRVCFCGLCGIFPQKSSLIPHK